MYRLVRALLTTVVVCACWMAVPGCSRDKKPIPPTDKVKPPDKGPENQGAEAPSLTPEGKGKTK